MSLARRLLLSASRSAWLARTLRQRAFFGRAVRRFMPGEDLPAALEAATGLAQAGLGSVLTHLGEQVTSRDEADGVRDQYQRVLDEIRRRELPAEISVKLTHLGDRKSTRLNSSHSQISYAVFCLKKKPPSPH